MKKVAMILVLSLFVGASYSSSLAQDIVRKKYCMSAISCKSTSDNLKQELLMNAKRLAVGEFFGELITSFTKVENFTLTEDTLTASSAGLVRVKGKPLDGDAS